MGKGLLEQINNKVTYREEGYELTEDRLRDLVNDLFSGFSNPPRTVSIYAGEEYLRQAHNMLGDKGFYNFLECTYIYTNTKGIKYIEEFRKNRKRKLLLEHNYGRQKQNNEG